MRLYRLYTGADQQSHLEEMKLPFAPGQLPMAEQTPLHPATGVMFTRMAPGAFVDWHNAPRRQYVITLAGGVEIGLGDGSLHRFGPGEGILAEDLTGKGHTTRAVGEAARVMMIVPLKD
jgi:quercetin dioxygenase-like cupin family protein